MRTSLLTLLLLLLTLAVHIKSVTHDFVNYDDDIYVVNQPEVRAGLSAATIAWSFSSFHGANWFPLTRLSWLIDRTVFGLEAWGFHLVNVLLHTLGTLVLFRWVLVAKLQPSVAFLVAAVFAVHPLHAESVAWISSRKDVLSGVFFFLTLLLYTRSRDRSSTSLLLASAAALAAGLLAKPTLVTTPFVLLLLDVWPLRRLGPARRDESAASLSRCVVEKTPHFLLVAAMSWITFLAQRSAGAMTSPTDLSWTLRIQNAIVSVGAYLGQTVVPVGLSPFYPHPIDGIPPLVFGTCAALVLGLCAIALVSLRRFPPLFVGWFWFLGMLVPVLGLIQVGQASRADRYTYLPLVGLTLPLAAVLARASERDAPSRRILLATTGAALLALSAAGFVQVGHWKDSFTLFRHALSITERNTVAHINLGVSHKHAGELDRALTEYRAALAIAPEAPLIHGLIGDVHHEREAWDEAIASYRQALTREPDSLRWRTRLGETLLAARKPRLARTELEAAVASWPERPELHRSLGAARALLGDAPGALASYREAVRLGERSAATLNDVARLLILSADATPTDLEEARSLSAEAVERSARGSARILDTHALALARTGRFPDAIALTEEALSLLEKRGRGKLGPELRERLIHYRAGNFPPLGRKW